jgi:hypothetical protein
MKLGTLKEIVDSAIQEFGGPNNDVFLYDEEGNQLADEFEMRLKLRYQNNTGQLGLFLEEI